MKTNKPEVHSDAPELKVGSTVWVFDANYRVYQTRNERTRIRYLVYREHWRPTTITGETRISWETVRGKFPKNLDRRLYIKRGERSFWVLASQAEVDNDIWRHEHHYDISRMVENLDPATLRKVAELIGYQEVPA